MRRSRGRSPWGLRGEVFTWWPIAHVGGKVGKTYRAGRAVILGQLLFVALASRPASWRRQHMPMTGHHQEQRPYPIPSPSSHLVQAVSEIFRSGGWVSSRAGQRLARGDTQGAWGRVAAG